MKIIQRVIYIGFAAVTIASASMPVFPNNTPATWATAPLGPNFEWYANVGEPLVPVAIVENPPPREGYIWSPGHGEWDGRHHVWRKGHWVRDDYAEQLARHNPAAHQMLVEGRPSPVFIERR